MNQQRSRRFRAAQESIEKAAEEAKIRLELGMGIDQSTNSKERFDSNCITPGTPFMSRLAEALRYFVAARLQSEPGWEKLKIILSDASIPGEGEHKIMDFIRRQRTSPKHNPNTRHVLYGLDADLIMLGLATHEPHFKILREDVFAREQNARSCFICGQEGHFANECTGSIFVAHLTLSGKPKEKAGDFDEKSVWTPKPFIFLHINVLREYLEFELNIPGAPMAFNLERAIDDWVFMCFFVGNDFLPHLPSLEIREGFQHLCFAYFSVSLTNEMFSGAIDSLISIYKKITKNVGGYLTCNGDVNLSHTLEIMEELGRVEDATFQDRRESLFILHTFHIQRNFASAKTSVDENPGIKWMTTRSPPPFRRRQMSCLVCLLMQCPCKTNPRCWRHRVRTRQN